jgi:hypothetical protein
MAKDDEETPVPPHRRSTGSITSWGIVEAWLAADVDNRIAHRMGVHGHELGAGRGDDERSFVWETVRPNEDPSSAAVRAIGQLPR